MHLANLTQCHEVNDVHKNVNQPTPSHKAWFRAFKSESRPDTGLSPEKKSSREDPITLAVIS